MNAYVGSCPSWANYVVTECAVLDGTFWAGTIETARSVARRFGGIIWNITPKSGEASCQAT